MTEWSRKRIGSDRICRHSTAQAHRQSSFFLFPFSFLSFSLLGVVSLRLRLPIRVGAMKERRTRTQTHTHTSQPASEQRTEDKLLKIITTTAANRKNLLEPLERPPFLSFHQQTLTTKTHTRNIRNPSSQQHTQRKCDGDTRGNKDGYAKFETGKLLLKDSPRKKSTRSTTPF